ncbi:MAG: sigma-54-dependent transcriptional regulator, partial [Phycisphaerae bacterium]
MADALRKPGHVCTIVHAVDAAMGELKGGAFDVIVTDLRMPASGGKHGVATDGADAGLKVLEAARQLQPAAEVIMVTAHGDVPTARAAFKLGAYDFIQKPLDLEVFRNLVNRAAETVLLRHQNDQLKAQADTAGFENFIATSEPMRRVLRTIRTVAPSNIPVLITGESGTGKELIALAVHKLSKRAGQPNERASSGGQ